MKAKTRPFLIASRSAIIAITIGSLPANAATTWDGGGVAITNIDEALNWGGTVNALNGTTAATFATGGSSASMNVPARFTTLTFNRDDAAGFTVSGASILSVNSTTGGGTINLAVSGTTNGGAVTISSPLQVYTTGAGTPRLLNIKNEEPDIPGGSLVIDGAVNASTPANTFAIRAGGTGVTVFNGTLSHVSAIQQVNSGTSSGKVIVNGNQSLGSATVNVPTTTSGTVSSAYTIQMGNSSADIQSWTSTAINQPATVHVKSTATLTGSVGVGNGASLSGATLIVDGSLTSATTLTIGSATATGTLKLGGNASFAGNVSIGAAAGSLILGNAASNSTLSLSGGTISDKVTIGGGGANENNISLTKINGGALTLNGTHTYTGDTTINAGSITLGGSIVSPAYVNSGGSFTVNGGTTAPVTVNASGAVGGTGTISNTLTFGSGNSTLNYALTGPLNANSVDVSAATAIIVSPAATPMDGTSYVALKRGTGTFSVTDFNKFTLATRGGALSLTGGATEITITPAASAPGSLVWKGNVNTAWEASPVQNWTNGGSPDRFYSDDAVTFDDTATSFTVNISGTSVSPGNMVFTNTTPNDYTIGGGNIAGTGSLTVSGSGLVTLAQTGTNSFSGALNLEAGALGISHLNQIGGGSSTRAVTLKGGTLQYTGNTQTTDAIPLVLNSGTSTVKVTTALSTLRFGSATTGSGNLVKTGGGTLALGKNGTGSTPNSPVTNNTFTGTVTVNEGALDVRNPDSLGSTAGGTFVNNAALEIFPFGQNQGVTIAGEPLEISGSSYFRSKNEDVDSDVTNQWTGAVTVAANAVVGIGSPKANTGFVSKLIISGAVSTGASSVINLGQYAALLPTAIQEVDITGAVSGAGSVTAQGAAGSVYTLTSPQYSGNTTVNSGKLTLGADNPNNNASSVSIAATGATLDLTFAGTDTVDKLFIGGVQQPAGVYSSSHVSGVFTGTGTLTVTSNPSGYSTWQSANSAGTQTVDQDHDNDGVDNGVEYFLGGNTNTTGFTALPVPVSGAVTWVKAATYSGVFGTDFKVQSSTDLMTWTDVSSSGTPNVPGTVYFSGANVIYTLPTAPTKSFVRLLVNPN